MKWVFLACLMYFALVEGKVLVLTDKTFDETVKSGKPVMVKFFAPWCGHCKALAPEYEKLAEEVENNNEPFIIAEVDATVEKELASRFKIRGYPTIKLFMDDIEISYEKERKTAPMLEFLKKKMEDPSKTLKTEEELKTVIAQKNKRCILISDNADDKKKFSNTGRLVEAYEFCDTTEELGNKLFPGVTKPSVVLLRDFADKVVYNGPFTPTALEKVLNANQFDIVSTLDDESAKVVFNKNEKKGVILVGSDKIEDALREMFRKLAGASNLEKYMFLVSTKHTDWGKRYLEYFGIEEAEVPVVEIVDNSGKTSRFRHTGKLTVDELVAFIKDYEAGKIEKFIKSEPIPEDNNGPVYKVVGNTFQKDIMDNDLDIFVKYYAPWCGHCKALAPIFAELAEKLKKNKKVRLVEIDATKNDIEGVRINSYPTLYLYQAGKKKSPKKFEGNRTLAEMTRFLEDNCAHAINPVDDL